MALVINDRVKENSTTSGTGNITLAGIAAGQGNVTFASGIGTSNTTYYCIFEQGTNTFEIGLGTLSGSTTLERTTVINNSSGSTSKINFTGGNLDVLPEELLITVVLSRVVEPDKVPSPISNVFVPCSKIQ